MKGWEDAMNTHFRQYVRRGLDKVLGMFGMELIRTDSDHQNYINLQKTLSDATAVGLSVGDYIDFAYNVPGATQHTVRKMSELGIFREKLDNVCEIGPGSGRYLEMTINTCHPKRYEIYETAINWRKWLAHKYAVIAHEADGITLAQTKSKSVNLVHAHKVFVGLTVLSIFTYFLEMLRVCAPEGYIVFDVLTENCFQGNLLNLWLEANPYWPVALIPERVVLDFFLQRGAELIGRFTIPMKPGVTDYFVFKRH
jgi:hypothetical protein